jgi:23S rRNA (guanosine2251-2'-O)-methyltransferase
MKSPTKRPFKQQKQKDTKTARTSQRAPHGKQILFGLHACLEALKNPKRGGHALFVSHKTFLSLDAEVQESINQLTTPIFVENDEIEQRLSPGDVHQGILLEVAPLPALALEDIVDSLEGSATVVILDQVTDPHNVGAILRSSAAFGVAALVMPLHHSAELNATLAKVASGALEYVPIVLVNNLKQAMDYLKTEGFWCVGLDERGTQTLNSFSFDGKTALVLGAEGKGLRRLTAETCDVLVSLPTGPVFQTLNVSNAAAVALYEIFCQSSNVQSTGGRKKP